MCENQNIELRFTIEDLKVPWASYFMSLDTENSFSEPRAENQPLLRKWLLGILLKSIFFKIPELVFRTAAVPIAAKNKTVQYNSHFFCQLLFFCAGRLKMPQSMSKLGLNIFKFISNLMRASCYKELVQLSAHVCWKKI